MFGPGTHPMLHFLHIRYPRMFHFLQLSVLSAQSNAPAALPATLLIFTVLLLLLPAVLFLLLLFLSAVLFLLLLLKPAFNPGSPPVCFEKPRINDIYDISAV